MQNILILFVIALAACSSSKTHQSDSPIEVLKATSQKWFGGVSDAGWGEYFNFKMVLDKTAGLTFDTVWIDNRAYIPHFDRYESQVRKDLGPVDTLTLVCEFRTKPDSDGDMTENPPQTQQPSFDGKALILYTKDENRLSYIVNEIEVLPALHYP